MFRGTTVKKLIENEAKFWMHGPNLLREGNQFSCDDNHYSSKDAEEEAVKTVITNLTGKIEVEDYTQLYPHHNSFKRTCRHFAWIGRAINNFKAKFGSLRARGNEYEMKFGPLTLDEIQTGLRLILSHIGPLRKGYVMYPVEVQKLRNNETLSQKGAFQHIIPNMKEGVVHVTVD